MEKKSIICIACTTLFFAVSCSKSQPATKPSTGSVSTFAGSGTAGYADGPGTSAIFNAPYGLAVDSNGNLLVTDLQNNCLRKISPTGVVTTLAGNDSAGYSDGTGAEASFDGPAGIVVDPKNIIYVAELYNGDIRRVTSAGVVTTAIASSAWLYPNPSLAGLALDAAENLYVTDPVNNVLYLVGAWQPGDNIFMEVAASKSNGNKISYPEGLAMDSEKRLFLANTGENEICHVEAQSSFTVFAGSRQHGHADGNGVQAGFYGPTGIAFDASDNMYVADAANNLIRKITSAGVVTTVAGNGYQGYRDGTPADAEFNNPTGVALDGHGNLYVADQGNNRIRKIVL